MGIKRSKVTSIELLGEGQDLNQDLVDPEEDFDNHETCVQGLSDNVTG